MITKQKSVKGAVGESTHFMQQKHLFCSKSVKIDLKPHQVYLITILTKQTPFHFHPYKKVVIYFTLGNPLQILKMGSDLNCPPTLHRLWP